MKINAIRSIKNSTNTKTNKKNLLKNQNLINFNGNLLKIVNQFANGLTQGIDKELSSNQLGENALKIKHKTNINISKNQFENMQLKKMIDQIKTSIQNIFKKHSNNSEFKPEEKPLVVWANKGPRDVNVSEGQRNAIAKQKELLDNGKITKDKYNSRKQAIDSYFTEAKKLPLDVSSSDIINNQPTFNGSAPQEAGPPPGHNARLAGATSPTPQQSMQYNMGHMTTEQLIIYKEFIEKRKKNYWD